MSVTDDRLLRLYQDIEPIPGLSVELINGRIIMTATPKALHNRIVDLVRDQFSTDDYDRWSTMAVAPTGRNDRPDPDLFLTGTDVVEGNPGEIPSALVLFVLEVVSESSRRMDHHDKRELYALGSIPVYLVVDPTTGMSTVHSRPDTNTGRYLDRASHPFGETVALPQPIGRTLRTDRFRRYT
jgi:Uma2 family endonuclease